MPKINTSLIIRISRTTEKREKCEKCEDRYKPGPLQFCPAIAGAGNWVELKTPAIRERLRESGCFQTK